MANVTTNWSNWSTLASNVTLAGQGAPWNDNNFKEIKGRLVRRQRYLATDNGTKFYLEIEYGFGISCPSTHTFRIESGVKAHYVHSPGGTVTKEESYNTGNIRDTGIIGIQSRRIELSNSGTVSYSYYANIDFTGNTTSSTSNKFDFKTPTKTSNFTSISNVNAPTLTVSSIGTGSAQLNISFTNDAIGFHRLRVKYSSNSDVFAPGAGAYNGSRNMTGLSSNTSYTATVEVLNRAGTVVATKSIGFKTAPKAPTIGSVNVSTTYNRATLSASGQSADAGIRQVEYKVTGYNWTTSNMFNVSGNTTYTAEARVLDNAGKYSNVVSKAFTTPKPSITNSLVISSSGVGTTTATISVSGVSAESGVQYVKLFINGASSNYSRTTNGTYSLTGLDEYSNYSIQAELKDNFGQTVRSNTVTFKTDSIAPTVSALNLNSVSYTSANLTVTATQGKAKIKSYKFYLDGELKETISSSAPSLIKVVAGLTENKSYSIGVEVVNEADKTSARRTISVTTPATPPAVVSFISGEVTPFTIETTAVAVRDSSPIVSYKYYLNGALINEIKTSNLTNKYTYTDLKENTTYRLEVELTNDKGVKSTKELLNVKTLEDKWVWLSVNGQPFVKCNTYLITPTKTVKIMKSNRSIIK